MVGVGKAGGAVSARLATPREVHLAHVVEGADRPADRTNCALSHLDYSWRDVDRDDLEVYLALDDTLRLREYLQGLREMEYERGERWPN